MQYTLCVLFGGASTEHKVSCRSTESVLNQIDREKYHVITVGITRDGRWLRYMGGDPAEIRSGAWEQHPDNRPCCISPDTGVHGLMYSDGTTERVDVIFPVLHGMNGEDGTMQGLFELARIPYVGCGVAASANTMDKAITKLFVDDLGITQARHVVVHRRKYLADPQRTAEEAVAALGLPLFVKPARAGSSIGVGKAKTIEEVRACIEDALQYDRKLVLEENIVGQEIEVAVFGDADGEVLTSCVGEIAPQAEFYTYEAKYDDEGTALFIPARISDDASVRVRSAAEKIYRCLSGFGLSRVDFFLRNGEEVVFNEINAIPGFTSISMYPQLFAASGIPYPELIDRLVMLAMER
ncbi:MAG: D-alanine--D-alanine ligase [Ruminococcaceae bacterium]|nr:D-alanine--D-alanine ligase [Oscillospiraceae bacterium]